MDLSCADCQQQPCHCWRALEQQRAATTAVSSVTWECDHRSYDQYPQKGHAPLFGSNNWWFGHRSIRVRKAAS